MIGSIAPRHWCKGSRESGKTESWTWQTHKSQSISDCVYVRKFVGVPTWLEGTVLDQIGPVSFQVWLADGCICKRHVDHVRIRYPEENVVPSVEGPSVPSSNGKTQQSGMTFSGNGLNPQRHVSVPPPLQSGRIQRPPDRLCWTLEGGKRCSVLRCMWLHTCGCVICFVRFRTLLNIS